MDNKNYERVEYLLYNYNMLKTSIENMEAEMKEIDIEDELKSISYEEPKVSATNKISSSTESTAIRRIEYKDLLKKRIGITQSKLKRLINALNTLTNLERDIVTKRYIEGKQWYIVAYEVSYNERWCRQIRKQAISKLSIGLYGDMLVSI